MTETVATSSTRVASALEHRRARVRAPDLAVGVVYLALAVVVLSRQWWHLGDGYLVKSGQDQTMWEWFFAVTAHSLVHLENPLGTVLQNHPLGVNMMANTAMFGVSIPLAPVTLLFGPTVTFVLVLTLGLFGTAFAWYRLFARELVRSRTAAILGGLFCGFAPAMISHASAHPNFVVLFLLPVIVLRMLAMLRRPVRPWRDGVVLGLLVAGQITLGEEPLLLFAIALALFSLVHYAHRPADGFAALKRLSKPVAIGALVALVLTGPALWWQFFGPQSYRLIDHGPMGNDLETFAQFPSESLGGVFAPGQNVAINPTEENAYFGWPLLVLVAAAAFWLWRNRVVRAAAVTIAVLSVLSFGSTLHIGKTDTDIGLPWQWFERYPLIQSVLETRFAMACVPLIAVLLALGTERALRSWSALVPWCVGVAVALLPLVPTPLPVVERSTPPAFFADGTWREFVDDGSVVTVPLPRPESASALSWQRAADFGYPIAGGYFVGPAGAEQKGKYGPDDRPTALLLAKVADKGVVPLIDAHTRAVALADLRFWRADVVVLPPTQNGPALAATLTDLLGTPGRYVDGVRVWDVRAIAAAQRP